MENIWEYDDFIFKGSELKGMTQKGKDKIKIEGHTDMIIPELSPEGLPITRIGDNAFYRRGLTTVVIPDTVESIGYDAFGVCKLKEVKLPSALVSIEGFAFYNNKLGRLSQFDIKQPKNYFIGAVGGDVVAFSDKKGKIEILGNLIDKEGKKLRSNELNEQMMEKGEITIKPLQKSNRQPFYMATKETMTGMEEQEFIISIKNHKIESMQFIENMDTNVFIINKIPRDIISQIILQDFIFTQKISKDTYIKHVGKELKNNQNLRNLLLSGLNDEYLTADQKKLKDELIEFLKRDENRKDILPILNKGENLDSQDVIKTLQLSPQKGRDMIIIGQENLSKNVLQWILDNNRKIAVDLLDENTAKSLGFKYPTQVRRTIGASEINHTLARHGAKSKLVQNSGQKEVTLDDISKWTQYADDADKRLISKDSLGQEVLISAKQINGYYVVVESIRKKHNELAFKTMYFENGKLENSKIFKPRDN